MQNNIPNALAVNLNDQNMVDMLKTLCQQRAVTYGFLSRLYRVEIDAETLDSMRQKFYPASTGNQKMDEGYHLLVSYLGRAMENSAMLTELAVDYVRVFFGHGVDMHSAAYPFESVHVSERRLLMQEARDEVLAVYRSFGLSKQDSWKEGEDHIALELEFMQILSERIVEALNDGNKCEVERLLVAQKDFMEEHLGVWAPLLTADMPRFAQTDFYKALAHITDGFVELDYGFLLDAVDGEQWDQE